MPTLVSMNHKITINRPVEVVFDYISDLTNDPKWRSEVDRMDVQGPVDAEGVLTIEYSTLFGGLLKTVTPTLTKTLERPVRVIWETPEDHPTWLESIRELRDLGDGRTEMSYHLSFDVPQTGLKGNVIAKILNMLYEPRLPKYMRKLKELLEAG